MAERDYVRDDRGRFDETGGGGGVTGAASRFAAETGQAPTNELMAAAVEQQARKETLEKALANVDARIAAVDAKIAESNKRIATLKASISARGMSPLPKLTPAAGGTRQRLANMARQGYRAPRPSGGVSNPKRTR